jgi:hypothetical protein
LAATTIATDDVANIKRAETGDGFLKCAIGKVTLAWL